MRWRGSGTPAWHDAHATLAPASVVQARTVEAFAERIGAALSDTRAFGPPGAPLGLCIIKADELHQLFVACAARGTGVADALIADGEARLAARGVVTAWLGCAVGNDRALHFYEKRGWRKARVFANRIEIADGVIEVPNWRYEKRVAVP